MVDNHVKN